jgi:hypothetical protein
MAAGHSCSAKALFPCTLRAVAAWESADAIGSRRGVRIRYDDQISGRPGEQPRKDRQERRNKKAKRIERQKIARESILS